MSQPKNQLTKEVEAAIDLLKKRWQLKSRTEVIERLLNEHDVTLIQIARRSLKLKNDPES